MLSAAAERVLWEQVIEADARANADTFSADVAELLDHVNLARLAAEAWKRIHDYSPPPSALSSLTVETAAFARWTQDFTRRLDQRGWLSRSQLAAHVSAAIGDGRLQPPTALNFVGFERSWPALDRLVECLRESGSNVSADWEANEARPGAPARVVAYTSALEEVRAVAREIRELLRGERSLRVGVVAADLSAARPLFDRVLAEELHPASVLLDQLDSPRRFDLAGAPALSDYPLVAHALELLSLRPRGNEFSLISRVLLSPYPRLSSADDQAQVAYQREREGRARTEVYLRDRGCVRVSLGQLAEGLRRSGAGLSASRVEALGALMRDDDAASPRRWAERFSRRLRAMGWPGGELSESEGVAYARWAELLGDFAALTEVLPEVGLAQALARISELAVDKLVQPPSAGLGVQVMGPLDAAGLRFERLYLVGFNARAFPAVVSLQPLLPARWQAEQGQPRASVAAEFQFAERVWRGLLDSAPEVIASYSVLGEGDEPRQPSPFLAGPAAALNMVPTAPDHQPWYRELVEDSSQYLVAREPDAAPPALVLSGGTGLLADQSACPFRALAARRLRGEALQAPAPGPQADVLGSLVHAALALAWERIGDSRALRALDEDQRRALAQELATALASDPRYGLEAGLRATTAAWLADLVGAWLTYEQSERCGEWRVLACETVTSMEFQSGVKLANIRVDRVDQLEQGGVVILDYKTASNESSSGKWFGERPRDPQLPVYALALAANGSEDGRVLPGCEVAAIGFANLASREKLSLKGPPECEVLPSGGSRNTGGEEWSGWHDQLGRWQRVLDDLAWAYAEGRATVDPLSSSACKYCRREALCRVFEGPGVQDSEEGDL